MTPLRLAWIVGRAAVLALILALPFSDSELISLEVWLAWAAVLVALSLLIDVIETAKPQPVQIAVAWTRSFPRRKVDRRPYDIRATAGMVLSAMENPRAHSVRLRPRLAALANHFLPIRHGIDPASDLSRTTAFLGDSAWLIDPRVADRVPTVRELEEFLDIVLAEQSTPTHTPNLERNE